MPVHVVYIPSGRPFPACIPYGHKLLIIFEVELTVDRITPNDAFEQPLPTGPFHPDDFVGTFRAKQQRADVTITLRDGRSFVIQIRSSCP